jgi:hypothetical protein
VEQRSGASGGHAEAVAEGAQRGTGGLALGAVEEGAGGFAYQHGAVDVLRGEAFGGQQQADRLLLLAAGPGQGSRAVGEVEDLAVGDAEDVRVRRGGDPRGVVGVAAVGLLGDAPQVDVRGAEVRPNDRVSPVRAASATASASRSDPRSRCLRPRLAMEAIRYSMPSTSRPPGRPVCG